MAAVSDVEDVVAESAAEVEAGSVAAAAFLAVGGWNIESRCGQSLTFCNVGTDWRRAIK